MKKAMMLMMALVVGLSFAAATFAGDKPAGGDKPKQEEKKKDKK